LRSRRKFVELEEYDFFKFKFWNKSLKIAYRN
jgi:hypothetical protein